MKKFFLFLSTLSLFALSSCATKTEIKPIARAFDEEETSEVVYASDADATTIQPTKTSWIEEQIVPLFGGISAVTLLNILLNVALTIIKRNGDKARNIKNDEAIKAKDDVIKALKEQNELLKLENAESHKLVKDVLDTFVQSETDRKEVLGVIIEKTGTMLDKIDKQNDDLELIARMKTGIEVFCEITAKSLSLTDAAVKSGIAEDARKLVKTLKGEDSDGKEE